MSEHGCAAQPGAAKELTRGVEALACAPVQLAADHLRGTKDTCGSSARPGGEPNPTKGVGERAHLLVASSMDQLRLGERFAAAHEPARGALVHHLLRVRAMAALQLDRRERRDAAP